LEELRSIVLMGLRGSGKTTIGARLVDKLPHFVQQDLDQSVLEDSEHETVEEIVKAEGWDGFRWREFEQLQIWLWSLHHLPERRMILSLGGGVPTYKKSLAILQSAELHGMIRLVYLRAKPATLAKRMESSADRPSLTGADPVAEIQSVFDERDELYRSIADVVIDVDDQQPDETASAVLSALGQL
jgi:shikimate kinase